MKTMIAEMAEKFKRMLEKFFESGNTGMDEAETYLSREISGMVVEVPLEMLRMPVFYVMLLMLTCGGMFGMMGPTILTLVKSATGTYRLAFVISCAIAAMGLALSFIYRAMDAKAASAP